MSVQPEIFRWLKVNLGPRCLAPLTSCDAKALVASWKIVELYGYDRSPEIIAAWAIVVLKMQHSTRYLAYHAVAQVLDWSDRDSLWDAGHLPQDDISNRPKCQFEPGGKVLL